MKTLLGLCICAAVIVGQAEAQPIAVVSPSQYADTEAPDSNGAWLQDARVQGITSSSVFTALPAGGATLTEISLRPDRLIQVGEQISFGRVQITLSVTQVDPSNLSDTFADNITGTPIVVYDNSWTATVVNAYSPAPATRPFDFRIPLQTPYHYDPADGNLLGDWIFEPLPGITNEGLFDIDDDPTADGSTTYTGSLGVDSPVSNGSRFSPVREFTFVPEPSTLALAGLALSAIVACSRRRLPG